MRQAVTNLLLTMLPVAVLAALDEVRHFSDDERTRIAQECARAITEHGDDLLYGGKHCAPTFAALARGLAVLAHQPGGVGFAGLHFCVGSTHYGTRDDTPCDAEVAREAAQSCPPRIEGRSTS